MRVDLPKQKPDIILFDWDNTLCDTWHVIVNSVNACLVHFGQNPWSPEEATIKISKSARELFPELFGRDKTQEALNFFYHTFEATHLDHIFIYDHVVALLSLLKNKGVTCGVVSNKRHDLLLKEIEHTNLNGFFDICVGAGIAQKDKPAPDPLLYALDKLNKTSSTDTCWYVGDSKTDILASHHAKMPCIIIETEKMSSVLSIYQNDYNFTKLGSLEELYNVCKDIFV